MFKLNAKGDTAHRSRCHYGMFPWKASKGLSDADVFALVQNHPYLKLCAVCCRKAPQNASAKRSGCPKKLMKASPDDTDVAVRDAIAFGEAIRDAREECGLTQEQLAIRIGTGVYAVNRVELGLGNFSLTRMHNFARAVGLRLLIKTEPIPMETGENIGS